MSFDTHPDTLVFGTAVPLLNTMAERELLMRRLCGIEEVIFAHFDEAMMHMPWEVFIEDYLVRQLRARHVVCGHDFHFGDRGQGNPDRLREKCRALGVGCDVIPEIQLDGQCVSSTAIPRASALRRLQNCRASARPRPACDRHCAEGRRAGEPGLASNGESAVFPGRARPGLRRLPRGGGA